MKTIEFKIVIKANTQKVWKALWQEENYKKWTSCFCPGSYYKTSSFTEGSKIHFIAPNGQGMYSVIDKMEANKFVAFRHLGSLKKFEELPIDQETETWTNAMETYQLSELENETELLVSVDIVENHIDFMNKTFPLALNELKNISEH